MKEITERMIGRIEEVKKIGFDLMLSESAFMHMDANALKMLQLYNDLINDSYDLMRKSVERMDEQDRKLDEILKKLDKKEKA